MVDVRRKIYASSLWRWQKEVFIQQQQAFSLAQRKHSLLPFLMGNFRLDFDYWIALSGGERPSRHITHVGQHVEGALKDLCNKSLIGQKEQNMISSKAVSLGSA